MSAQYANTSPVKTLFLGLLTHQQSTYPRDPFLHLFQELMAESNFLDMDVRISVYEINEYSWSDIKLKDLLVRKVREPLLGREWNFYLHGSISLKKRQNDLRIAAEVLVYSLKLLSPNYMRHEQIKYARILNINHGHIKLMQDLVDSNSYLGIILEDDAGFELSKEFILSLMKLISFTKSIQLTKFFIDLSESFSFTQLDTNSLIYSSIVSSTPNMEINGHNILRAKRPFTNTVCAVLYSRDLSILLLQRLEYYSLRTGTRIIGIDWLFNMALLEFAHHDIPVENFHLDPGFFVQKSLNPNLHN